MKDVALHLHILGKWFLGIVELAEDDGAICLLRVGEGDRLNHAKVFETNVDIFFLEDVTILVLDSEGHHDGGDLWLDGLHHWEVGGLLSHHGHVFTPQ